LGILHPTDEAFQQNFTRAQLQVAICKTANKVATTTLDPLAHWWVKGDPTESLVPRRLDDAVLAPNSIMK